MSSGSLIEKEFSLRKVFVNRGESQESELRKSIVYLTTLLEETVIDVNGNGNFQ